MKYIEYAYLAGSIFLVIFLSVNYDDLSLGQLAAVVVAIAVSSFMYTVRKKQRIMMEARDREELEKESEEEE